MYANEVLRLFPGRRVKAFDGMAVTADVWDAAHEYHRRLLEIHTRFAHGPGILYGLEVIAGEPADRQVYVQPGIAVDQLGRTIILAEPRGYDLRSTEGQVYLLLTHEEGSPRSESGRNGEDAPRYIYTEYSLQATLALPQTPYVELARIRRQSGNPVVNARVAELPGLNEIDLRHRIELAAVAPPTLSMAVATLGRTDSGHVQGAALLAKAARTAGRYRLTVDHWTVLDRPLAGYALLYLVGLDAFRLDSDQMTVLYNFHKQGGNIFYESCRAGASGDAPGDAAFLSLVSAMGQSLQPVAESDPLLREPHFFPTPPDGFETQGSPRLLAGEGLLFSSYDYGCLWQGKRRGRTAGRGELRSAYEFGENILAWAMRRRRAA